MTESTESRLFILDSADVIRSASVCVQHWKYDAMEGTIRVKSSEIIKQ